MKPGKLLPFRLLQRSTNKEMTMIQSSKSRRGLYGPEWVLFIALVGFAVAVVVHAHGA